MQTGLHVINNNQTTLQATMKSIAVKKEFFLDFYTANDAKSNSNNQHRQGKETQRHLLSQIELSSNTTAINKSLYQQSTTGPTKQPTDLYTHTNH